MLDAAVLDVYGAAGYGQVRPQAVAVSGTGGTNEVVKIAWSSWGGATATGTGTGCVLQSTGIEANCAVTHATVVAYDLGSCSGTPAYLEVTWYFPSLGQSFTASSTSAPQTGTCGTPTAGSPPPTATSTSPPTATTTPPSASTTTSTGPPVTVSPTPPASSAPPAAPCTASAITTAAKAATTTFLSLESYGCTGDFAYAFLTITGPSPTVPAVAITELLEAANGAWQVVTRGQYCTENVVPAGIYQQGCETA